MKQNFYKHNIYNSNQQPDLRGNPQNNNTQKKLLKSENFDTSILNQSANQPKYKISKFEAALRTAGILIARASFFPSCCPFGLSFMAVHKRMNLSAIVAATASIIGYASLLDFRVSVKYICCIAVYLLFLFVTDTKERDLPVSVTVSAAGIICLLSGITEIIIFGFDTTILIKTVAETAAAIAGGFAFNKLSIILNGKKGALLSLNIEEKFCLAIFCCVMLSGLWGVKISSILSFQLVAALTLTCVFGISGGSGYGAICGLLCGFVCGLTPAYDIDSLYLSAALAFGGTVSGFLKNQERYIPALLFGAVCGFCTIFCGSNGCLLFGYADIPTGVGTILFLPESLFRNLRRILGVNVPCNDMRCRDYIHERLEIASNAFRNLAGTLFSISDKDTEPDFEDATLLFDTVADRVCRNCSIPGECWVQNYDNTYRGLFKMLETLEVKGGLSETDTERCLGRRCLKVRSLTREMNALYEIYRINSIWKSKLCENRRLAADQLGDVSRILDTISEEVYEERIDSNAEDEIRMRLCSKGYEVTELDVTIGAKKRYFAYIGGIIGEDADGFRRSAETALKIILGVKMVMIGAVRKDCDEIVMRFAQPEGYIVETGTASCCACENSTNNMQILKNINTKNNKVSESVSEITSNNADNKISDFLNSSDSNDSNDVLNTALNKSKSGDRCVMRYLSDGKFAVALSDGMGTGRRAARDSNATVRLLGDFLEAGFDKTIAVKFINSIMVMKSADEAFATVDMCIIDLFSGNAEFIKNGAEPCYIKRGYDIETVRSASLPVGVVQDIQVETFAHRLSHGDMVVMMSDGIFAPHSDKNNSEKYNNYIDRQNNSQTDKNDWIKTMIAEADPNMPPRELADRLLEMSKNLNGGKFTDDVTVCVIKICRR